MGDWRVRAHSIKNTFAHTHVADVNLPCLCNGSSTSATAADERACQRCVRTACFYSLLGLTGRTAPSANREQATVGKMTVPQ